VKQVASRATAGYLRHVSPKRLFDFKQTTWRYISEDIEEGSLREIHELKQIDYEGAVPVKVLHRRGRCSV
jgi:hypothetical protein